PAGALPVGSIAAAPRASPAASARGREDSVPVYGAPWDGLIPSDVCFVGSTARMTAEAGGTLESIADAIKSGGRGSEGLARATASETKDPRALAERRLKSVVAALVTLGVPRGRILPRNMGTAPPSAEVSPDGPSCIEVKFQFGK